MLLHTKNIRIKTGTGEGHKKLLPKWLGPFRILAKVGKVAYRLQMPKGMKIHPVFHVSLLKPYKSSGRVQPPMPEYEADDESIYEVESILDHRITSRGKKEYKVKWAFYGH